MLELLAIQGKINSDVFYSVVMTFQQVVDFVKITPKEACLEPPGWQISLEFGKN